MKFGMSIIRGIMVALVLGTTPVALNLPPEAFWELGPIENTEIASFLIGTVMTFFWYITDTQTTPFRNVWLVTSLLFFLGAAREASWGRIFLASGMDENGPIVPSMKSLWFGNYIYSAVGVLIVILLYMMYKYRHEIGDLVYRLVRSKESMLYFGLFFILLGSATVIWDPNRIASLSQWHQAFEEMSELTAYFATYALAWKAHLLSQETVIQDTTSNMKK